MTNEILRVDDLRVAFHVYQGTFNAVDGVSFSIRQGEVLGLVGESGCGKSVTSLAIMRLLDKNGTITGGRVLFQGRDLASMPLDELQQVRGNDIAMIFQEPLSALNPVYTVGEQIAETVALHQNMNKRDSLDKAIHMLELVGIPDAGRRAKSYPHQLSGGMRQRVMIAMALSCEPALLIADEPTTALDVTIQAQILELMRDLRAKTGTAILLITHDLGVIAEMADRVAVMYAGKIAEVADVNTLFGSPQMPYTVGLLDSIPHLGMDRKADLHAIEGSVPTLFNMPGGCRFGPRCEYRMAVCSEQPPLFDVGRGQHVACWLHQKGRVFPDRPLAQGKPA
ncbi:MAG: ABC transporter ATP-binding protein [Candidatus Dormibacteria bacterium]